VDRARFWRIVAESKAAMDPRSPEGNQGRQVSALRAALERIDPQEIIAFRDHLWDAMIDAYRWDLWAAAYLLGDGCSEDGFLDFRSALVAMGREVFERALREPDSLWNAFGDAGVEDVFFEGFLYVPREVYETVASRPIPKARAHPSSPSGTRWADDSELQRLLPTTWDRTRG